MAQRQAQTATTLKAAKAFTRRTLLRCGLAAGATAIAGCRALSQPVTGKRRRLAMATLLNYFPQPVLDDFTKDTGIGFAATISYRSDPGLLPLIGMHGRGNLDLATPSAYQAPLWREAGLLQPIDMARIDAGAILAPLLAQSEQHWTWDGALHHLPMRWHSEGLAWRSDQWTPASAALSYGDLWRPETRGRLQCHPHSMMFGIGLYLDSRGELPSNRFADSFRSPAELDRVWGGIVDFATDHLPWLASFWGDGAAQQHGFLGGKCVIGQCWDSPALKLQTAGRPVTFMPPREGALAWMDGLAILAGTELLDEIYVFLNYLARPEVASRMTAAGGFAAGPVGTPEQLTVGERRSYLEGLPGNALDHLWFLPAMPEWYRRGVRGHVDRFLRLAARR